MNPWSRDYSSQHLSVWLKVSTYRCGITDGLERRDSDRSKSWFDDASAVLRRLVINHFPRHDKRYYLLLKQ